MKLSYCLSQLLRTVLSVPGRMVRGIGKINGGIFVAIQSKESAELESRAPRKGE